MSLERNKRVQTRYDELAAIGKHGHYETMFQVVNEEVARLALPVDVVRLVIAGRRAFDLGYSDEEFHELDLALEAFSTRVPYDPE